MFPATSLGPAFFKDVRAPLPHVKLMPTGGVSVENAGDWIRAGAVAVGVGSALIDPKAVAAGDFASITAKAKQILANVRAARLETTEWQRSSRSARSCFGSARLGYERFFQSPPLSATFGGGEANVAVSLAQFGLDSFFVTRLPAHAIGEAALRCLRG